MMMSPVAALKPVRKAAPLPGLTVQALSLLVQNSQLSDEALCPISGAVVNNYDFLVFI